MAYMDFRVLEPSTDSPRHDFGAPMARDETATVDFTALEWTVISLARHDRGDAGAAPGGVRRLIALLFGGTPGQRLANPRLEALRTLAARLWNHREPSHLDRDSFLAAQFTPAHLDLLRASVANAAGAPA